MRSEQLAVVKLQKDLIVYLLKMGHVYRELVNLSVDRKVHHYHLCVRIVLGVSKAGYG